MWVIIKYKSKEFETLKDSFYKVLGEMPEFYSPKYKYQKYVNNKLKQFETKILNLEEVADEKTEKSKTTGYYVDEEFVYPKDELKDVIDEWRDKEFFLETYNKETGQMEGGYYPEEASYMRDEQGKIIRDEYGRIKEEPTFLEKWVPPAKEFLKEKISPFSGLMGKAPAPPLPNTPMPDKKLAATTQINPATQLTRTETALLSPSEQAIRQKQRGVTT